MGTKTSVNRREFMRRTATAGASSFRGLQESIVNYGGNELPEFLTCCHEACTSPGMGAARTRRRGQQSYDGQPESGRRSGPRTGRS